MLLIRAALDIDAQLIAEILRETGWFDAINSQPFEKASRQVGEYLEQCNKHGSLVLIAELEEIVGFAVVDWRPMLSGGLEGYLSQLYVRQAVQGQGIGRAFIDAVSRIARDKGCHRLMTYVSRDRETYRREFYPKAGFVEREDVAQFRLIVN